MHRLHEVCPVALVGLYGGDVIPEVGGSGEHNLEQLALATLYNILEHEFQRLDSLDGFLYKESLGDIELGVLFEYPVHPGLSSEDEGRRTRMLAHLVHHPY